MTAFRYLGGVERLKEEVAKDSDVINQRYREILGEERFAKLEDRVNCLFSPEIFFDDVEQLNKKFSGGVYESRAIPRETPSKILLTADVETGIWPNGAIKANKAKLGIGFYVSEESFKHSGSAHFTERIIATYIHEFNHFVSMALQKVPIFFG